MRATMEAVVAGVRAMIGDTAATPEFDDDAIEAVLDTHRFDDGEQELRAIISRAPDGSELRLGYQAGIGPWEAGVQLRGSDGALLAAAEADEQRGRWTFADDTPEPVTATGSYYDANAAAADLLDEWAARLARRYDFSAGGQTFSRSQRYRQMRDAAANFRRAAFVLTSPLVRSDVLA